MRDRLRGEPVVLLCILYDDIPLARSWRLDRRGCFQIAVERCSMSGMDLAFRHIPCPPEVLRESRRRSRH
jgi:hypothetical protein